MALIEQHKVVISSVAHLHITSCKRHLHNRSRPFHATLPRWLRDLAASYISRLIMKCAFSYILLANDGATHKHQFQTKSSLTSVKAAVTYRFLSVCKMSRATFWPSTYEQYRSKKINAASWLSLLRITYSYLNLPVHYFG